MQDKVYRFVEEIVRRNNISGKVLDIGSLDINGTVKPLFSHCKYIGLDMQPGKNVDIVENSHNLLNIDGNFDCVVCLEMLEHDNDPFQTAWNIYNILCADGHLIATGSGIGFPKHEYPHDYWRFTAAGFKALFNRFVIKECFEDYDEVFLYARKSERQMVQGYK